MSMHLNDSGYSNPPKLLCRSLSKVLSEDGFTGPRHHSFEMLPKEFPRGFEKCEGGLCFERV